VVTLGCNIHDNMVAYVVVTDAPFFGRTDAKGVWVATNLPSGNYHVRLWHPLVSESSGALERTVQVDGVDQTAITLKLAHALRPAPLKGRPHSWDY
ncbi:MAG TPA: hypothetical protein VGO53_05605, partial [Steroidobacteraceae bacterium]|nr:hypothetical protein [Steroidobacteraceae bacterium]